MSAATSTTDGADTAAVRQAIATTARPPRPGPLSQALTFGWRGMLKVKHVPEQLLDVTVTPVMFLLLFTFLFGGAIAGSTSAYLDYTLPGLLVMSVLFTTVYSGRRAEHRPDQGRRRPVPVVADLAAGAAAGLAAGRQRPLRHRRHGDHRRGRRARATARTRGCPGRWRRSRSSSSSRSGCRWVFCVLGLLLRSPNAVMNAGFMGIFPLTFLSNVFVDPATLPGPLEAFVNVNPVSILATASRSLMDGDPDGPAILISLAVAAVLAAVFLPITTRLYRSR